MLLSAEFSWLRKDFDTILLGGLIVNEIYAYAENYIEVNCERLLVLMTDIS
ncbi:MAG: hypothetical protein Tsb002_08640 [Wenzhouxiangellaceae bacterium]